MKSSGIIAVALGVLLPVVANAQGASPNAAQEGASQLVTAAKPTSKLRKQFAGAQNRVNGYFREAVATPKLRECWSHLQGKGGIAIDFTYRRSGSRWAFEKLALIKSNLPAGQEEAALRCMQDSVAATSFPVAGTDLRETYAKALVVRWTWPVPLPPKVAKMIRNNGAGGLPDSVVCAECQDTPSGRKCVEVQGGGYMDCRTVPEANMCSFFARCLTGIFGTSAGYVIY
jgi:hypothetical protein